MDERGAAVAGRRWMTPGISRPSAADMGRFFLWLGTAGFGGPIALVGYMEREFVDRRQWVTSQELKDGIAFSQLAPGPLAAQLAIYLGWLCGGIRGATVSGVAFIGPSFLMVLVLAALYLRFGGIGWLQSAFYGVGAAVIAIVARSAVKLTRGTLGRDRLLWILFGVTAVVTAWTESEIVWLFVLCGLTSMLIKTRGQLLRSTLLSLTALPTAGWWTTGLHGAADLSIVFTILLYFASAGLFVFGSGLAIVPFLHGGVVQEYRWLTERQFLDAVAVALITPGPVVITVAFIGYLVAGPLGAIAAGVGVFAPTYVITIALAPHYERLKSDRRVRAFVDGVTAAATGAIAGAAFVLGRRAVTDLITVAILAATFAVLTKVRKVPEPLLICAAGVVGIVTKAIQAR
jgi:chromate transporter